MPSYVTPPFLGGDDTDVMAQLGYDPRLPPPALIPQSMYPQVAKNATAPGGAATAPFPAPPELTDSRTPDAATLLRLNRAPGVPTDVPIPAAPGDGYQDKLTELANIVGQRPVRPEPKWWQRVGGAAAGFGAGWSNAASRTKHPIDIGQLHEDILAPGYQEKLARWQSQVAPVEAQAQIEGQKQGAWWKNQEIQSKMERDKAYADALRERMVEVTPEMSEATGGLFKPGEHIQASTANEIARIAAGKYEKPEKTFKVTDPDIARRIGVAPGTDVPYPIYQAGLKPVPQPTHHNRKEEDILLDPDATPAEKLTAWRILATKHPGKGGGSRGTDAQFRQIEKDKKDNLLKFRGAAQTALANTVDENERQRILNNLTDQEQLVQNGYEQQIQRLGGEPQHYTIPVETGNFGPETAPQNRKPLTDIIPGGKQQQTAAPQGRKPLSEIIRPQA